VTAAQPAAQSTSPPAGQRTGQVSAPTQSASPSSPDAALELQAVTRCFGSVTAVDDVDLVLAGGEFFSLLGPSGCGKTTTLRMVGGFDEPDSGRILLEGQDVTAQPPYRRGVNTVFQNYALFPHLTVSDNVAFGLRRKGLERAETKRRVGDYLSLVGLEGLERRRPTQLSGGQQQRVALARALVNHPKLLLLDEPMGALDARIRKSMQVELKRIQRDVGITFLYVTHDQNEAMAMSDRLAVMRAGRCEDIGPPTRVYDQPGTRFVAQFLGTCNLVDVEPSGGQIRLTDGTVVHVGSHTGPVAAGTTLGVRPEKLTLRVVEGAAAAPSGPNAVAAHVTMATYLGASSEYEVTTSVGTTLTVFAQNLNAPARAGDAVVVSWDARHAFLLPPETSGPAEAGSASQDGPPA
jgi:spermidine/putrescine transport system ATP-binding protein